MIAICDCNSFYAACHILFHPELWNKPVVVLSNNRGVMVSLNQKAKNIGLRRGMTEFENTSIIKKHKVSVLESNYELYYDMSDRVMSTLAGFVKKMEVYSIDESFLCLKGYEKLGYHTYCKTIADTVTKNTGIPISIGVAKTKTLAKIANRFAKKYVRFNNVFVIDTEQKRMECLKRTDIKEVWGIRNVAKKLNLLGINTAWDFVTQISQKQAKKIHSVELERTWCELNGIECDPIITIPPDKKSFTTSRSFPHMINDLDGIKQAISTYAAICAADLRKQNSYAVSLCVSLYTNRFKENLPQYNSSRNILLPIPSNNTITLVNYALKAIKDMFIPGFWYKKGSVSVTEVTKNIQTNIYSPIERETKLSRISPTEDFYAHGFDRKLCGLAVMGFGDRKRIELRQENPLVCPTSRFQDIIKIDCTI